jgi:hypothetical protein
LRVTTVRSCTRAVANHSVFVDGAGLAVHELGYLLDTKIVSELRKPRPNPKVVAWLQDVEDSDLHLSAVTVGEIQAGIEVTRTQDPTAHRGTGVQENAIKRHGVRQFCCMAQGVRRGRTP